MPLLRLSKIKKTFNQPDGARLPILDIEQFNVDEGEPVALIGSSGSGKTTLLHIIAGITRPDSGIVEIGNTDITQISEAACDCFRAERIGYVFQTFNLLPAFSALENVLLGMSFSSNGKVSRSRALELLKRVGLEHRLSHKPSMLSVGEQQRVAVARSLANRPQLLLADEPTANVDAANQQQMIDLIRETCDEEKIALLMVTHSQEVADQFDRTVELEKINRVSSQTATTENKAATELTAKGTTTEGTSS